METDKYYINLRSAFTKHHWKFIIDTHKKVCVDHKIMDFKIKACKRTIFDDHITNIEIQFDIEDGNCWPIYAFAMYAEQIWYAEKEDEEKEDIENKKRLKSFWTGVERGQSNIKDSIESLKQEIQDLKKLIDRFDLSKANGTERAKAIRDKYLAKLRAIQRTNEE